ncbi:MAG: xanthine dehydrogenase small subunit [Proteobacteria bacterium]|nr:xanthine dehydrogenase small subunit [Pseudomonadota bacterium]
MSARDLDVPVQRRSMRFILDGEVVEIENVDPNRTVLQYLREDLRRCGTKEGCAEGDCGACTVVVVDRDVSGKRLRVRAVNSCIQFLPTLDGKELLTVESLSTDGELHPTQKALVDCHGSQCGFCTPGFVMSLFALHKNNADPTRREIDEALAGNLCRCTGYSPIVEAARVMYADELQSKCWLGQSRSSTVGADEQSRIVALNSIDTDVPLCIEGHGRKFFAPRELDHFADLVALHPDATILSGGTDVGLWVTKQQRDLPIIIYTGNVAGLNECLVDDGYLDIGAAVSLTDAMPLIIENYPTLEELFVRFASPPIRNAGTLGGNIANGSPIGDSMPALIVLETEVVLRTGGSTRSVALNDFYLAYQRTALRPGEFIERIRIPLPVEGEQVQSYKISKRFDQDISAVCGAYRLQLADGKVEKIGVAYGGMAAIPSRASLCEQSLMGQEWSEASVSRAMQALDKDFSPISDMRSSSQYRRNVCRNLLRRFYLETSASVIERVYSIGR